MTQQKINREYLASTYVSTPDPRQAHPPVGQMLTMMWKISAGLLKQDPKIALHVIYWDYTEQTYFYPITNRFGYVNYRLLEDEYYAKRGILTYKAEIVTPDGQVHESWRHQLWVNLINIDNETTPPSSN